MNQLKNILGKTAPLIGSLLGGPLGASIGQLLGRTLLGNEKASEDELGAVLLNPTPAQLIALKQIEANLQKQLSETALEEKKLVIEDLNNARMREVQLRDRFPALLAVIVTLGFFGILLAIMFCPIKTEARQIIDIMLGALGTAWISCVTYYFGSSHGSQTKNLR